MAQEPTKLSGPGESIDYTPAAAVTGGDVVVVNGIVGVSPVDIAANQKGSLTVEGLAYVPKTTAAWTAGLPVYWNSTGDPDGGTSGTGAANQLGNGVYMGLCPLAAASGDDRGYVLLNERGAFGGGMPRIPTQAVTATGSSQSDAAALFEGLNVVTGADGTKGVLLPAAVAGAQVIIKGVTAGVLKVYPATGDAINALSANAAYSLTTGAMPTTLIAYDATTWYSLPLVAS